MTRLEHLSSLVRRVQRAELAGDASHHDAVVAIERLLGRYFAGLNLDIFPEEAFSFWYDGWTMAGQEDKVDCVKEVRERNVKTDYARDPHLPAPVQPARDKRDLRRPQERVDGRRSSQVAPLGLERFTVYKVGREVLYVDDAQEATHHVPEAHWEQYLRLRTVQPMKVVLYDTLTAARVALVREHRVRI